MDIGDAYIDFCVKKILLQAKRRRTKMWREFKEADIYRGERSSQAIARWVADYIERVEPKEVDVKMLSGEIKVMSMDAFKELIK